MSTTDAYILERYTGEQVEETLDMVGVNSADIKREKSDRVAADSNLREAISAEGAARKAADDILQEAIDEELSQREAAESNLQGAIDKEAAARKVAVSMLNTDIANERNDRVAADSGLREDLNAEVSERKTEDGDIRSEIAELTKTVPNDIRTDYSDDGVSIDLKRDGVQIATDTIEPATEELAGVMSAADKIQQRLLGERIEEVNDAAMAAVAAESNRAQSSEAKLDERINKLKGLKVVDVTTASFDTSIPSVYTIGDKMVMYVTEVTYNEKKHLLFYDGDAQVCLCPNNGAVSVYGSGAIYSVAGLPQEVKIQVFNDTHDLMAAPDVELDSDGNVIPPKNGDRVVYWNGGKWLVCYLDDLPAAFGKNSIDGDKIADGAITTEKIADGAVKAAQLDDDAVGTAHIQEKAITRTQLGDDVTEEMEGHQQQLEGLRERIDTQRLNILNSNGDVLYHVNVTFSNTMQFVSDTEGGFMFKDEYGTQGTARMSLSGRGGYDVYTSRDISLEGGNGVSISSAQSSVDFYGNTLQLSTPKANMSVDSSGKLKVADNGTDHRTSGVYYLRTINDGNKTYHIVVKQDEIKLRCSDDAQFAVDGTRKRINAVGEDFRFVFKRTFGDEDREVLMSELVKELTVSGETIKDLQNALAGLLGYVMQYEHYYDGEIFVVSDIAEHTFDEEQESLVITDEDLHIIVSEKLIINGSSVSPGGGGTGNVTRVSQLLNDKGYLTGNVTEENITFNDK